MDGYQAIRRVLRVHTQTYTRAGTRRHARAYIHTRAYTHICAHTQILNIVEIRTGLRQPSSPKSCQVCAQLKVVRKSVPRIE